MNYTKILRKNILKKDIIKIDYIINNNFSENLYNENEKLKNTCIQYKDEIKKLKNKLKMVELKYSFYCNKKI